MKFLNSFNMIMSVLFISTEALVRPLLSSRIGVRMLSNKKWEKFRPRTSLSSTNDRREQPREPRSFNYNPKYQDKEYRPRSSEDRERSDTPVERSEEPPSLSYSRTSSFSNTNRFSGRRDDSRGPRTSGYAPRYPNRPVSGRERENSGDRNEKYGQRSERSEPGGERFESRTGRYAERSERSEPRADRYGGRSENSGDRNERYGQRSERSDQRTGRYGPPRSDYRANRPASRSFDDNGDRSDRFERSDRSSDRPFDRSERSDRGFYARDENREPMFGAYDGDHLYGINPIYLALRAKRRIFSTLFVQNELNANLKKDKKATEEILRMAKEYNVPIEYTGKHELNMLCDSRPHQGFVLRASPLGFTELRDLDEGEPNSVILALDEVVDPQNFGALLRTAHFLNVHKVVVCSRNSAPLSPPVSKSSAGAMEVREVHNVKSMLKFLDLARERGWTVIGTALTSRALPLSSLPLPSPTPPLVLVLGNEGTGVRTNVLNRCHHLVQIEGGGKRGGGAPAAEGTEAEARAGARAEEVEAKEEGIEGVEEKENSWEGSVDSGEGEEIGGVDSLNVSVTGGILLHYFLNK